MPKTLTLDQIHKTLNDHTEANRKDEVYAQYLKVFNENWDDDEDLVYHLELLTRLQGMLISILPSTINYCRHSK